MNVYMLRDNKTGLFYKRQPTHNQWVPQEKGSLWPDPAGANAAKGSFTSRRKPTDHLEVVEFELRPAARLALVTSEDWEGLYVNGVLEYEGHHVHRDTLLRAIGVSLEVYDADDDWLLARGNLPENLCDVVIQ